MMRTLTAVLVLFGAACSSSKSAPSPPPDMARYDLATLPDLAGLRDDLASLSVGHSGHAVVTGGVAAKSAHYQAVLSTGQAPGGSTNAASSHYQKNAGLAGATQK